MQNANTSPWSPARQPSVVPTFESSAEKLRLLAELRRRVRESAPSRWYCGRPGCDGEPHVGMRWCDHPDGVHEPTCRHARWQQVPPQKPFLVWAIVAGRGAGKTRGGSEWVHEEVRRGRAGRVALVARSAADVRDVMIEGDSGLLATAPPDFRPQWQPTKRRVTWPNGAQAFAYSSQEPDLLRGPQHHISWGDELSSWNDAHKGDRVDTTWNNLMLGLRLKITGVEPRCIVTTTPKPNKLTREIMKRASTITTSFSTYENLSNLAPSFKESVLAAYEGTRLGRQELMGEMLEDIEGALWRLEQLDETRVRFAD